MRAIAIRLRRPAVLGSVSYLDSSQYSFVAQGEYRYFYEWKAGGFYTRDRSWNPQREIIETNTDALIGARDYVIPKPDNTVRIIAIGDSFTEGPYVVPDKTYPRQLESLLNLLQPCGGKRTYEVLNFGVGGYDIEYAALRLGLRGPKYGPDAVIWLVKDDDFIQRTEVARRRQDEYMRYVRDELGGDISNFGPYLERRTSIPLVSDTWLMINEIVAQEQERDAQKPENVVSQTKAVRSATDAVESPVIMFTYKHTMQSFIDRMEAWTDFDGFGYSRNIPQLIPREQTLDPFDSHPNHQGYAVIAEAAYDALFRERSVCSQGEGRTGVF